MLSEVRGHQPLLRSFYSPRPALSFGIDLALVLMPDKMPGQQNELQGIDGPEGKGTVGLELFKADPCEAPSGALQAS